MEDYIAQCEKAMQRGKRVDLPIYLQTKLAEQKREQENKALQKTTSPAIAAETVSTPPITGARSSTITTTIAMASVQDGKEQIEAKKKEQNKSSKM